MQTLAGGSCHKCATSKTGTRHTEFSKYPAKLQPNTALQITGSRTVPEQGAAPRHTTAHWEPNRRPYTTERPFFTQQHTIVPALVPSTTNHRSHSLRTIANVPIHVNRQSASQSNAGRALNNNRSHTKGSHTVLSLLVKVLRSSEKRSSLNPGAKRTNAQSHNSLARSTSPETS